MGRGLAALEAFQVPPVGAKEYPCLTTAGPDLPPLPGNGEAQSFPVGPIEPTIQYK
nr:MAG TPA: hypothetical protein [Siphoviridae sp. ctX8T1]